MELSGNKIPKKDHKGNTIPGKYYDHVDEMENSLNGLRNAKKTLQGALKNPNLDPGVRKTLEEYVKKADENIKKIYDVFNSYGYKPRKK